LTSICRGCPPKLKEEKNEESSKEKSSKEKEEVIALTI
jgi:hypothetical protein